MDINHKKWQVLNINYKDQPYILNKPQEYWSEQIRKCGFESLDDVKETVARYLVRG